ncbi:LysR family transcriptional regulator [Cupriavidus basilensis]|uniref:LysR family transcriptional regulator n=1 Tax=Cupriavidus basilensis TaxID=68895 RepID=A0A643G008_9BURK|nr:LysR family transcriptional regulator [Cupriavidus basilensis]
MNLASIDLNLLVAFEAVFETRNVTLAAQRLHRAQPSVSNALSRLRTLFQDELFMRTAAGMVPTERAMALMPSIGQALMQIREVLDQGAGFDPATARGKRFTIAASDYADIVVVPHILARLRRLAPHTDLRVAKLDRAAIYKQLDEGVLDMAIGGHLAPPKRMLVTHLYEEQFVCIADRRHPRLRRHALDLQTFIALPHALFVPSDDGSIRGVIDENLARLGVRRRVAATFAHIIALPYAVQNTDLVATLARRAALQLAGRQIALHALPPELGDNVFSIDMVCSRRVQGNAALEWLRHIVGEAVGDMERKDAV